MADSQWATKKDKKKYVGKIIQNAAKDQKKKSKEEATEEVTLLSLIDSTISRDSVEQMIAAIYLDEILEQTSPKERELFNDRQAGYEWAEIANNRNMNPEAARQAFARLKRKAAAASKGKSVMDSSSEDDDEHGDGIRSTGWV